MLEKALSGYYYPVSQWSHSHWCSKSVLPSWRVTQLPDSVHGSVPMCSPSNDSKLQRPLSPMGKSHFTPVDSGYQSLLASPLSETNPHLVASSPIPADQISLQGQLSDDLQPDPPTGTLKGCLHNVTQPCKICQSAATTPSQQHDVILDTSVFHSSTLILVWSCSKTRCPTSRAWYYKGRYESKYLHRWCWCAPVLSHLEMSIGRSQAEIWSAAKVPLLSHQVCWSHLGSPAWEWITQRNNLWNQFNHWLQWWQVDHQSPPRSN